MAMSFTLALLKAFVAEMVPSSFGEVLSRFREDEIRMVAHPLEFINDLDPLLRYPWNRTRIRETAAPKAPQCLAIDI